MSQVFDAFSQTVRSYNGPELRDYIAKLPQKERKAAIENLRATGDIAPKNEGVITEAGQAIGDTFLRTARGIGSTVEEAGLGSGMYNYFDEAMATRRNWEADPGYSALSLNPGHVARTLASGLTQTAMIAPAGLAGSMVGGPVGGAAAGGAVVFAQLYGDNVKEYRDRLSGMGYTDSEIKAIAGGRTLVDSAIETALGAVPAAGRILSGQRFAASAAREALTKSAIKQVMGKYGKDRVVNALYHVGGGAASEGAEEVLQEFNGYVWRAVAGDSADAPGLKEYAEAFAGGALTGGVLGGAEGISKRGDVKRVEVGDDLKPKTTPSVAEAMEGMPEAPAATEVNAGGTTDPATVELVAPGPGRTDVTDVTDKTDVTDAGEIGAETASQNPQLPAARPGWGKHYRVAEDQTDAAGLSAAVPPERMPEGGFAVVEPQSKAARVMAGVADDLGLKVKYFVPADGSAAQVNGVAMPDGTLWIDAGASNQNPAQTLGHEFTHYLEQTAPDLAGVWRDTINAAITDAGKREVQAIAETYGPRANPDSEFAADRMGEMWLDPQFWTRAVELAESRNAGFGDRIVKALTRFVEAVRKNLLKVKSPAAQGLIDRAEQVRETAARTLAEFKARQAAAGRTEAGTDVTDKTDVTDAGNTGNARALRMRETRERYDAGEWITVRELSGEPALSADAEVDSLRAGDRKHEYRIIKGENGTATIERRKMRREEKGDAIQAERSVNTPEQAYQKSVEERVKNNEALREEAVKTWDLDNIIRDVTQLRKGDYAAIGHTTNPAIYKGEVVSIGRKNVKLKTQSTMYGEQITTLPISEYKAHYKRREDASLSLPRNIEAAPPTESEAFKRWFGDSKVVDENGKPLVVYHGTGSEFYAFDRKKADDRTGRLMGLGAGKGKFYFTESEPGAEMAASGAVATGRGDSPRVMPVYIRSEKTMDRSEYNRKLQALYGEYPEGNPKNESYDYHVRDRLIAKLDRELKNYGYDGVWDHDSGEIFVFEPNQIKSATDNVGTYDPENPDIRYSLPREPESLEDFRAMQSHSRPERLRFSGVKELYDIYKREYLGRTIETPSGHSMTFKPGHFFRLIAATPEGGKKGVIAKAKNAAEAIRMIERGEVGFKDIAGYQAQRADNLPLFKDVVTDADFYYHESGDKIVFGKKYQGLNAADGFLAVTLEVDDKGNIGILSFHPRRFTDRLLGGKEIKWNIARPVAHANDAGGTTAGGQATIVKNITAPPAPVNAPADITAEMKSDRLNNNITPSGEKSSGSFSLPRRQVNPIVQDGKVRAEYQDLLDNDEYDVEHIRDWEEKALRWIERMGGTDGAVEAFGDSLSPAERHVSTIAHRLLLESGKLTPEQRRALVKANIEAGTAWGREGVSRRLDALNLDSHAKAQEFFDRMAVRLKDEEFRKVRNRVLDETGVDISALPEDIIGNPELLDKVVREAYAANANIFDKAYEWWINSILSAPTTHAANIFGNTANMAAELGPQRLVEIAINKFAKRKGAAADFGEFRTMWAEFAKSFPAAWNGAREAFQYEAITSEGKLETHSTAIRGEKGRVIRLPGRFLRAADEFAKSLIIPAETAARAYREGRENGLAGDALQAFITAQLADPQSKARREAVKRAKELTFQQEPGAMVKHLMTMRESQTAGGYILKFLLPFLKTPANILDVMVRKGPLGVFKLPVDVVRAARGTLEADVAIRHAAEQVLAWSAVLAVWGMMGGDDDDDLPMITGAAAPYGSSEGMFKGMHVPPYSIRIGDTYFSYKRIEPFASGLAFVVDGINTIKAAKNGRDMTKALSELVTVTAKQALSEKTFLDGIGDVIKFLDDPERNLAREGGNYLASWVPNVVRSTMNAFDDNARDYKSRAQGAEWWKDQFVLTAARAGMPGLVQPKIDYFGREIPKDAAGEAGPVGVMWRLLAPSYTREADNMDAAERLLWRYNQRNPDEAYWPGIPSYLSTAGGKTSRISGEDYTDFAKKAGQLAHRMILAGIRSGALNAYNPGESDIKAIKKIFSDARGQVRDEFRRRGRFR